ncbi:unnamed protein product [Effrenium voratum]|nr:unnamed protein product [Effrenium voratum]
MSGNIASTITAKLEELRGKVSPDNLFSPSGANGEVFKEIWSEANLYFNEVCLTTCSADFQTLNASEDISDSRSAPREYIYDMAPDSDLKLAFDTIKSYSGSRADVTTIKDVVLNNFRFDALPLDQCPYSAKRCVPMPGVEFQESDRRVLHLLHDGGCGEWLGRSLQQHLRVSRPDCPQRFPHGHCGHLDWRLPDLH